MAMSVFLASATAGEKAEAAKSFINSIGIYMIHIEPGDFIMGSDGSELPQAVLDAKEHGRNRKVWLPKSGDYDEQPAHKVTITRPFYMAATEVTRAQYELFDPLHVHLRGKLGFSIDNDEAVVFVSWYEAAAFCEWLSKKEGIAYRLPTEAEWEYCARAGTATSFSTGDDLPREYLKNPSSSWYPDPGRGRGRSELVPLHVGKTPPNPWGLYDMHGNVEEWCADFYGPYVADDQADPIGRIDGDFKVTRGGSHATYAYYLRSANRMGTVPRDRSWLIGFRVVSGELSATNPLPKAPLQQYQKGVNQSVPRQPAEGPDPKMPYFRGPRNYVKIQPDSYGPLFSRHNHCSAVVECPNGDLLATWFTTQTERGREMALAASRLRYGAEEWDQASLFWDAPDRNDPAQALWSDDKGVIYHFSSISVAATWGPLAVLMRSSTDSGATWSKAKVIIPEHGRRHQVIESVFRTREGFLVLPCDATPGGGGGTALHVSRDGGRTWFDAGGTIAGIHAAVTQLEDGRLLAFGRGDTIDGRMPKSMSEDMGKTWSYSASAFPPIGGGQRLVLLRLREGPLFLASFASQREDESAPKVFVTDASGTRKAVTGLFGAVSYDSGETWPMVRLFTDDQPPRQAQTTNGGKFTLSQTSAEPKGYLSVCQGANGLIHLTSSWNHYAFNLKWLETPPPVQPQ